MKAVQTYINEHKDRFLEELMDLLRIPSVSADPAFAGDVLKTAEAVAEHLRKAGADAIEVVATEGHPIVYGEKIIDPNKPTVMVYGHYDVQPADPVDLWDSGPFDPVVKKTERHPDGAIYARGSCNNKGQIFIHIKAFEAMMATNYLPCNIKFLIEEKEKVGPVNLG